MQRRGFLVGLITAPLITLGLVRPSKGVAPVLMSQAVSASEEKTICRLALAPDLVRPEEVPPWLAEMQICAEYHLSEEQYSKTSDEWKRRAMVYLRGRERAERGRREGQRHMFAASRHVEVSELKTKFTADLSELEAAAKRAKELHAIIAN